MSIKIALLGGPGTGKSTQCAHFFSVLKSKSVLIEQIQEWVREAFNNSMIPDGNPWVQLWIYEKQKRKEDCIPVEIKYIVTDSPTILSYIYALNNGNIKSDAWLFIDMYEKFLMDLKRYDYIFICEREKEYVKDGTRKQSKEEAMAIDAQIKMLLDLHKMTYHSLNGTTEERTKQMCSIMKLDGMQ